MAHWTFSYQSRSQIFWAFDNSWLVSSTWAIPRLTSGKWAGEASATCENHHIWHTPTPLYTRFLLLKSTPPSMSDSIIAHWASRKRTNFCPLPSSKNISKRLEFPRSTPPHSDGFFLQCIKWTAMDSTATLQRLLFNTAKFSSPRLSSWNCTVRGW